MSQFTVEVKGIPEVKAMLSNIKNGANKAIARSLNKTVKGVKTDSAKEIVDKFNVTQATVKRDFKTYNATYSNLSAKVEAKGKPVPLGKTLRASQTAKGVTVIVKKSRARKLIPHAFKSTVGKGGHKGIFVREYTQKKGYVPSSRPRQKKGYYAHLPGKYRFKIEEKFTSRIPDVFGNDEVMNPVLKKASERLEKNMSHEADFVLENAR